MLCLNAVQGEGKPESNLKLTDTSNSLDEGDWTFVSAWGRRKNLPQSPEVPLHNRHDALGLEIEVHMNNGQEKTMQS